MRGRRGNTRRALALGGLALGLALGLSACGGGEAEDAGAEETTPTESVTITGVDYGYQGVPPSLAKDSQIVFTNASSGEAHELALYRIDDDEDRRLEELIGLPDEESRLLITFEGLSVALPGQTGAVVQGDLVLDETGRYALVCFVPTGVDPQAYLDFAQAPEAQAKPTGGPEHITMGMFAELTVE